MVLAASSDSDPTKIDIVGEDTSEALKPEGNFTEYEDGAIEVADKSLEAEKTTEGVADDVVVDENQPPSPGKSSLRSPKILSKLKPFSPKSLTSPRRKGKPNHFNEPSPKSIASPKNSAKEVVSPLSPKKKTSEEKVSLAVAPGRLGLTLKIDKKRGGAEILSIHPRCAFHKKVNVGDYIVSIDGRNVRKLEDFKVNSDMKRNFVVRRTKKAAEGKDEACKENETTEPENPAVSPAAFSQVDMNADGAQSLLLSQTQSHDESHASNDSDTTNHTNHTEDGIEDEAEGSNFHCAKFNCAQGQGIVNEFVSNRFSCANTVGEDSTSSIKTFLKPITSLMECGHDNQDDYKIDIDAEEMEEMNDEVPTIAEISKLQVNDHAYIRRSNGGWTYSTVLEVRNNSITFSVDNFGNGKTITAHRWQQSIRLVRYDDEEENESTVAEEYSMSMSVSTSSSDSQDDQDDVKPLASPTVADRKAKLKTMVEEKKMFLKAKKQEKKRQAQQAKVAKAKAKRKEKEMKEAQELEMKLRLMHLEELKITEEAEIEKEKIRIIEETKAKNIADLEEMKKKKLAKIEAKNQEKNRKKLAKKQASLDLKREKKEAKMLMALEAKAEKQAKIEQKKLQKARKHAAALEAQRQAELVFQDLEAVMLKAAIMNGGEETPVVTDTGKGDVNSVVDDFLQCDM